MRIRGMTLIDVVVGTSIMLIIFLGIFGAFKISIELVYSTKAKTGAVSLMTEQLEYIRSLSYDSVGTVGGIPSGAIPQIEEKNLNGLSYLVKTLVQYTDAPEDGLDALDDNGITADYKTVKVSVTWDVKGTLRSTFAVTRIAPNGQESLAGGGTLRVNVFNQEVDPVANATVRIVNTSTSPTIDVSAETNANGSVSFPGTPEGSGYEIYVSKSGYSSAETYGVSLENPNPSPIHVSVVESQTTTASFSIDTVATLRLYTFEAEGPSSFTDSFVDGSNLSSAVGVSAVSGALQLDEDPVTGFEATGEAFSTTVSPEYLSLWDEVVFTTDVPEDTSLSVRVYYFDGSSYVLVPDIDLPGNSGGFDSGTIDISTLDTTLYGALRLGAVLTTSDSLVTPELLEWTLSYTAGPSPLPNVSLDLHGSKTIGTDSGGQPIYKYSDSVSTDSSGEEVLTDIEWDAYTLSLPDPDVFDVVERCPNTVSPTPGQTLDVSLTLGPDTARSLRVSVTDGTGAPVVGATVTLSGPQNVTGSTSACGQIYFGTLSQGTYTVAIQKSGFQTSSEDVGVSGENEYAISLLPN